MCLSPVLIRNPNLGIQNLITRCKDTVSAYIPVPCGVCAECVANRQVSYVQRLQAELMVNLGFFCTLTYNDYAMPVLTTTQGYDIRYADVRDLQNMMKRLRKSNAFGVPFRYLAVSELGSKRSRPHFHIIFLVKKPKKYDLNYVRILEKRMFDAVLHEWRRNVAPPVWSKKKQCYVPNARNPKYIPLCTYVRRYVRGKLKSTFDFHYLDPRSKDAGSSVSYYVTKYMMKPSKRVKDLQIALKCNYDEAEYESIWSVVKPRVVASLGLGLNAEKTPFGLEPDSELVDVVRKSVLSSYGDDSPKFMDPTSGLRFPLSRYYKSQFYLYTQRDYEHFWEKSKYRKFENVVMDEKPIDRKIYDVDRHDARTRAVDDNDQSFVFDEILNK